MQEVGISISSAARYSLVGAANTLIYSGLLFVALEYLKLSTGLSVTISYCIAILFHFTFNRIYVFKASAKNAKKQALRYLVFAFGSYLLSFAIVYVFRDMLAYSSGFIVAINVGLTTSLGYLVSAFWVYK